MKIGVYSDPHLGKNLTANTTPSSRKVLKQAIYSHTMLAIEGMRADAVICAGDLLDTYSNDEATLLQALNVIDKTDLTLAGNHDVHSSRDARGTMDVLAELRPDDIVRTPFGELYFAVNEVDDYVIVSIPHHTTQELFETALRNSAAQIEGKEGTKILITHSNYECPFATDETSLNLTKPIARKLLETFDYIVLGHDHNHKKDFDGRLIVLGNLHPTGFGDISDKYIVVFEDGQPKYGKVWDAEEKYIEVTPDQIDKVNPRLHQFVRIVGKVKPAEMNQLAKDIKKLWSTEGGTIFAIRSEVKIDTGNTKAAAVDNSQGQMKLTDIIEAELAENEELLSLWKEVSA